LASRRKASFFRALFQVQTSLLCYNSSIVCVSTPHQGVHRPKRRAFAWGRGLRVRC